LEARIFHTRISIHPLLLLMILLAVRLGLRPETSATLIALFFHETAHLAAAACTGVHIPELRLMPFGGSAHIGNPYALSGWQLGVTAAAGPAANLLLIILSAALAHWGVITLLNAVVSIRINLMLMLFNLLPALPLDGGRILYAALYKPIGPDLALTIGIWAGRLLAACLLVGTLVLFLQRGIINLSFVFAAVFLIASAPKERTALHTSNAQTLISALSPVSAPTPVRLTAIGSDCSAQKALRHAKPEAVNLFAVYSESRLMGFTDDRALIDLCLNDSSGAPVSKAALYFIH